MKTVGNSAVWKSLLKTLPSVAILEGPPGSGRRMTAKKLTSGPMSRFSMYLGSVTSDEIMRLAAWASVRSKRRVVIVDPVKSSPSGWNRLLWLLENAPPGLNIWIIGNGKIPSAILSRAMLFVFAPLTSDDVIDELRSSRKLSNEDEQQLRKLNPTSITEAVTHLDSLHKSSVVASWVTSVWNKSYEEMLSCISGWDQASTNLLVAELERQADGESLLFNSIERQTSRENILYAIRLLKSKKPATATALLAGLRLLQSS